MREAPLSLYSTIIYLLRGLSCAGHATCSHGRSMSYFLMSPTDSIHLALCAADTAAQTLMKRRRDRWLT